MASEPTSPPRRIDTHRIDTLAVRLVQSKLPADWIVRTQEDRDYGIDLMVEVFDGEHPTGVLILLQVKGHKASFGNPVVMQVPVKTLLYARMFLAPFFLFNVSLADNVVHYVWLQKYINTKLANDSLRWERQTDVNIHFPKDNVLDTEGLSRIFSLTRYTAHRDLGFTFLGHLAWLYRHIEEFHQGGGKKAVGSALERLNEIKKLDVFIADYEEIVESLDLEKFARVLAKAKQYGIFDYGDDELVDKQILILFEIQSLFLSRDETDASVAEDLDVGLPY